MHVTPYSPPSGRHLIMVIVSFRSAGGWASWFRLGKKKLGQLTLLSYRLHVWLFFTPSMNYALCMNKQWLNDAWFYVFLRIWMCKCVVFLSGMIVWLFDLQVKKMVLGWVVHLLVVLLVKIMMGIIVLCFWWRVSLCVFFLAISSQLWG